MSKLRLNTFHLKIIALIFMIIDHIGYVFIPETTTAFIVMRCIGRLSAPIFWFCFAEGYKHTSDKSKYVQRLFAAGVFMGIINMLLAMLLNLQITFASPNMFLTMALMATFFGTIKLIKTESSLYLKFLAVISVIFLAVTVIKFAEYGIFALVCISIFYYINNNLPKLSIYCCVSFLLSILMLNVYQMFMMFAMVFLLFYKDEKPKQSLKLFFYIFYPAHLWIFLLIAYFIK